MRYMRFVILALSALTISGTPPIPKDNPAIPNPRNIVVRIVPRNPDMQCQCEAFPCYDVFAPGAKCTVFMFVACRDQSEANSCVREKVLRSQGKVSM